jgi:hypothetical protein
LRQRRFLQKKERNARTDDTLAGTSVLRARLEQYLV